MSQAPIIVPKSENVRRHCSLHRPYLKYHNATTQVRVVKNTTKPPPQGVMTHLVQWPADIDGAVLNDIINNLRQRGGEIWVRKLKKKNTKIF